MSLKKISQTVDKNKFEHKMASPFIHSQLF